MLRRAALALGIALLGTFVAFEAWVYTHRTDAPPVDDADLASRWQAAPDAENGYARLAAAAGELAWAEEDARRLSELRAAGEWDHTLAQAMLAANRNVLIALDASLEAPVYRPAKLELVMPDRDEIDAMVDQTIQLLSVDELCSVRALDSAYAGADDAAVDQVLRCFHSGLRRASMEGANLSDAISAVGTQRSAVRTLARLLAHVRPTAAESRRHAVEIEALGIPAEAWRNVWAEEYRRWTEHIEPGTERGGLIGWLLPAAYLVQPNRIRALLASEARALRAVAGVTCAEANVAAWPSEGADVLGWTDDGLDVRAALVGQALVPNGVGEILAEMTTDLWRRNDAMRCFANTNAGGAQVMIALRAYSVAHGVLPATLAELVPVYLPQVPADGYDGAPLRYSRERKLVWSVGEDLVDSGGDSPDDSKCCRAEPKWEIRF